LGGGHYTALQKNKKTMKVPVSQVELDLALEADLTTKLQIHEVRPAGNFVTIEEAELLSNLDISQEVMANDDVQLYA
jgi:hypothetical protein